MNFTNLYTGHKFYGFWLKIMQVTVAYKRWVVEGPLYMKMGKILHEQKSCSTLHKLSQFTLFLLRVYFHLRSTFLKSKNKWWELITIFSERIGFTPKNILI